MSTLTYQQFTGTATENYQRAFVPLIATPVSRDLLRAADIRAGEHILDVACGTGLVTRQAAEHAGPSGSAIGVDIAPDMIGVAQSISPPDGAPIVWHIADATALPIPDRSVDVTLCQMGLMFIENRKAAIAEMHRVLRPSGRLAINTPGPIQPFFAALEQALVDHISADLAGFVSAVFSMHDADDVAELVGSGGFGEVDSKISTTTLRLPPPEQFIWQYINLTPMAPLVAQAPDPAKVALERQFVERIQAHVADGVTVVELPMVIATGRA